MGNCGIWFILAVIHSTLLTDLPRYRAVGPVSIVANQSTKGSVCGRAERKLRFNFDMQGATNDRGYVPAPKINTNEDNTKTR